MSPQGDKMMMTIKSVPRASGDEPHYQSMIFDLSACSPRERG